MQGKYPVYINYNFFLRYFLIFYSCLYKTIHFFLSCLLSSVVCCPRLRSQSNCVFRSIATRKHNETLRLWPESAELREAIGASVRTICAILSFFDKQGHLHIY